MHKSKAANNLEVPQLLPWIDHRIEANLGKKKRAGVNIQAHSNVTDSATAKVALHGGKNEGRRIGQQGNMALHVTVMAMCLRICFG